MAAKGYMSDGEGFAADRPTSLATVSVRQRLLNGPGDLRGRKGRSVR